MTIRNWEVETPDDLPDYVSDTEDQVMQDAPEEVAPDASEEEYTDDDDSDDDDSDDFLDFEFHKNINDDLKELGITVKKFNLLQDAFPDLCDAGPNTTFNAVAEADWARVLAKRGKANMAEVIKKQEVIARLRKAVPRIVVTDVDDFAQVLDDDRTDDVPLPIMWRVLLLHPCVRRAMGSSLYFWDERTLHWHKLRSGAGDMVYQNILYCLFSDPANQWRVWLMQHCHPESDEWLILTQEDQIAMQRLYEELDNHNRRPELTVPSLEQHMNDELDAIIDDIVMACHLGNEVPERDPFAWCNLQEQVHEACPSGCECDSIFKGGEVKHAVAWDHIEKLTKVPLSALLQQIGMSSSDEGALLPGAWSGKSDLDVTRALQRDDRTLLMNIRLRCNEFYEAIAQGAEVIDQYSGRYSTAYMLDFVHVGLDTVFMSVIKREIHLEMHKHQLNWAQVMELLNGKPYDHRARWSARLDRLEEETAILIATRATRLPRADDVHVRVVHVPEPVFPAYVDSNSDSRQLNSELSETSEASAPANYSAEDLDAAASLLLLAAGGAGDDHGSAGESPVSSTEGANGAGNGKRKRAEDMFDKDEAESKRQKQ
ncbi:hypothetical protein MBLNU457_5015t1 [Dothideomycetes sp. NU457]